MNRLKSILTKIKHTISQSQKTPKKPKLQQHWEDVMLGKCKSFLPVPDEAIFPFTTEKTTGLREELDGIRQRLSILEDNGRDKPCRENKVIRHDSYFAP